MKKGLLTVLLLVIICLAAVSGAAERDEASAAAKERCPVCRMFVAMFADWNAKIEFKDATHATFDGAKCLFKYYLEIKKYDPSKDKKEVATVSVKDYYSKTAIDASRAFYVIWSDTYGPMGHEPIPFAKEAEAKKFLKEHKGKKILRFQDITAKVIRALDNP